MKKFLFVLVAFATLFLANAEARRVKFTIPVDNSVSKVSALPDSSYYKTEDGLHLDLGYIEQDGSRILVLFSETKPETYYDIPDNYVEILQRDLNVTELTSLIPDPTFWDKWGGSILFYGIAALIVIGLLSYAKDFIFGLFDLGKKKDDDDEDDQPGKKPKVESLEV